MRPTDIVQVRVTRAIGCTTIQFMTRAEFERYQERTKSGTFAKVQLIP